MVTTQTYNVRRSNTDYTSTTATTGSTWADINITQTIDTNSSFDFPIVYTVDVNRKDYVELEIQLKKSLKKLMDKMSKEGWIEHADHYVTPKLPSIKLRAVRLDGRGWASN